MGWFVDLPKSSLVPAQRVVYLGFEYVSVPKPYVAVPVKRLMVAFATKNKVLETHTRGVQTQGRLVARVAGVLQSMRLAVQPLRMLTSAMCSWLATLPRDERGFLMLQYHGHLSEEVLAELQFWERWLGNWNASLVSASAVDKIVYTDRPGDGWGGFLARAELTPRYKLTAPTPEWESGSDFRAVRDDLLGLRRAVLHYAGEQAKHSTFCTGHLVLQCSRSLSQGTLTSTRASRLWSGRPGWLRSPTTSI